MTALNESALVAIPTFNERKNLSGVIACLRAAESSVDILVADGSSPDGTGKLADEIATVDEVDDNGGEHIYVLHRGGEGGLWGAYRAGFAQGLERGYEILCEVDAGGSHAPEQFHPLLEKFEDGADAVVDSRYVPSGKTVNWSINRQALPRSGSLYISLVLGTGISDIIAGYRAYRRGVLETLDLESIDKAAHLFQTGLAFETVQAGFLMEGVPITSTEREYGESKMDDSFVKQSLLQVIEWRSKRRSQQVKNLGSKIGRLIGHEIKQRFRK